MVPGAVDWEALPVDARVLEVLEFDKVLGKKFRNSTGFKGNKILLSRKHDKELMAINEWRKKEDFLKAMDAETQKAMRDAGISDKLVYHEAFDR